MRTEQEIIKGCIKKDASCQRMLFETYSGRFMSICLRYACDQPEAEDILQDAFINIFSYIHQFKGEGSFEGWMRRIVVNTALRVIQKKKIRFTEIQEYQQPGFQVETSSYTSLHADELIKLINALPDGYRIVFNLNVIEGYSHEEIAQMLQIAASTSRSQLLKARRLLQEQIKSLEKIAV